MSDWRHLALLGVAPPGTEAPQGERLRFVRSLSVRTCAVTSVLLVALVFAGLSAALVGLGASVGLTAVNVASLTYRIRRLERA